MDSRGQLVPLVTMEHAVHGRGGLVSDKGDSGSLVLNNAGQVVGLLVGGCAMKNTSYFTHAADLIADIKEVTGAKSVKPMGSDVSY